MQSDFFQPFNDLMTEAHIFCNHRTAKDWFYYYTNRTITNVLMDVEDQLAELEWIEEHMWGYVQTLTKALEGYERYEMCKRVTDQANLLGQEISNMWVSLSKLNK